MTIKVGTFNLNNLFSRFNFAGAVPTSPAVSNGGITLTFSEENVKVRSFMGRLVKEKDPTATRMISDRILNAMACDIIAVQEVEHIEILNEFNRDFLRGMYSEVVLVEGNDNRLIDVGLLSRLPIGAITSHQALRHPARLDERVFSRDLLQVEVLKGDGSPLLTIYNTHMKSHFVPHDQDQEQGKLEANARRRQQAEITARVIAGNHGPDDHFILLGDMNDPPDSPNLTPMLDFHGGRLVNGLDNAVETRPAKPETIGQGPGPATKNWTHRFNPPGAAHPIYEQFDQIWMSPSLASRLVGANIDRRTHHGGDGSDHDPAWIELEL